MRASGDHRQRFQKVCRALGVLALSVGLLTSTGCARRFQLTAAQYEKIENQEMVTDKVSVYVSKKLVILYMLDGDNATFDVNTGTIEDASSRNILRVNIGKNTRGVIIDAEERNGARLVWVTFSEQCQIKDCSYGFVQTEDAVFRLHSVPEFDGYTAPRVYFKTEKKEMKLGKLKSLAEKNDVYLWKNPRDKIFTTDLIVKKRNVQKTKKQVVTPGGIKQ